MLRSWSRSTSDPGNELLHLYEVRDALAKHCSGEKGARAALGISGGDWSYIGRLADAEPIEQGRHRGRHPFRRNATGAESEKARNIIRKWIIAQANIT
jgi:hypothetical protein